MHYKIEDIRENYGKIASLVLCRLIFRNYETLIMQVIFPLILKNSNLLIKYIPAFEKTFVTHDNKRIQQNVKRLFILKILKYPLIVLLFSEFC